MPSAPSVLEYARFHNLAVDHTAEDLLDQLSQSALALTDHETDLPDLDFSSFADHLTEPKLQLSHQGGRLLAESVRAPHHVIDWDLLLPNQHRVRKLKIEEPVITGDHETDIRRIRQHALDDQNLDTILETCSMISSASDESFDDEWRDIESGDAIQKVGRELEDERCHTTKETLIYLSNTLRNNLTDEEKAAVFLDLLPQVKVSSNRAQCHKC